MDKAILPECYADTLLVQILVPPLGKTGYNHQHGCNEVQRAMRDGAYQKSFALGIIDKDKKDIAYLDNFDIIAELPGSLILWRHQNALVHHYIIQICPVLEQWIFDVCNKAGIDLAGCGFSTPAELQAQTKSKASLKNPTLKKLFSDIKLKHHLESVRKLTNWIRILRDDNYRADINDLKNA